MALGPRLINSTMNSKFGKWLMGPYSIVSPAAVATVSCLTKDGANCAFYTWQALTNKRIPEDKRSFIASLDLSNGILNIITQLGTALALIPFINKVYDKHIGKKLLKTLPEKIVNLYKNTNNPINKIAAADCAKNLNKAGKAGLSVIVTLIATQIFCKRVVVPSLATPMAAFLGKKLDKRQKKDTAQQPNPQPITKDTVSFENRSTVNNSQENKKLPDCFHSFMK